MLVLNLAYILKFFRPVTVFILIRVLVGMLRGKGRMWYVAKRGIL
jgi:hypothetical protein